jgi:hypothetical protein
VAAVERALARAREQRTQRLSGAHMEAAAKREAAAAPAAGGAPGLSAQGSGESGESAKLARLMDPTAPVQPSDYDPDFWLRRRQCDCTSSVSTSDRAAASAAAVGRAAARRGPLAPLSAPRAAPLAPARGATPPAVVEQQQVMPLRPPDPTRARAALAPVGLTPPARRSRPRPSSPQEERLRLGTLALRVAPLVSPQAWLAATMRKMDSDAESDAAVRRIDAGAQAVFMTRL